MPETASPDEQDTVRELQRTLYRAAKVDPGRRFHALYDEVHRRGVLERAWEQVRRNRGVVCASRAHPRSGAQTVRNVIDGCLHLLGSMHRADPGIMQRVRPSEGSVMEAPIFHIVPARDFEQGADPFAPASLGLEGFIHCSAEEQVPRVAAALFAGRTDLLLVGIDPGRLEGLVTWEDCYETGEEFPHIYGPLPQDAVIDIRPYLPDERGRFPDPGRVGCRPR